jgi:ribonucleoside-diphosphate reductase alpha chain
VDYEKAAYPTLLSVDNVIDPMDYPFPQLEFTAKVRRSVGIGITNLAFELASKWLPGYTHRWKVSNTFDCNERHSYWLHKASLRLRKERGNAARMHKTKYPCGWLPTTRQTEKSISWRYNH